MAADRVRISFMASPGLLARVDVERGGVPRERWLREAVERALGHSPVAPATRSGVAPPVPAPAEQPAPDWDDDATHRAVNVEWQRQAALRSSAQAKRDVRPIPKGGK